MSCGDHEGIQLTEERAASDPTKEFENAKSSKSCSELTPAGAKGEAALRARD
jgi:hypothetical protein